jgi:hypothetical protein
MKAMLKKRTAISAMFFCGTLLLAPGLSQASPLSWMQGVDVLAKMTRLWTLLPGVGHTAVKPAAPVKNGVGIDPQGGQPTPTSEPGSGATTSSTGDPGTGI